MTTQSKPVLLVVDELMEPVVRIWHRGQLVKTKALPALTLGPGASETLTTIIPFSEGPCWSPDSPELYNLQIGLNGGRRLVDRLDTQVGFREFWLEGRDMLLNGRRITFRRWSSCYYWYPWVASVCEHGLKYPDDPHAYRSRRTHRAINCIRFHYTPVPGIMWDTADDRLLSVAGQTLSEGEINREPNSVFVEMGNVR